LSLRVGLVGCGRWGANVLRDLLVQGADVAVADLASDRRAHAHAHGAASVSSSATELSDCDGYVVVTPAPTHRQICEELLGRGAPVFVEKPPCTSLGDVEALAEIANGRLFVMHKWRYHDGILALARVAAAKDLGEPLTLETTRIGPFPLPDAIDVLWHLGVHDLSIGLEILGGLGTVASAEGTREASGRLTACSAAMAYDTGASHRLVLVAGSPRHERSIRLRGSNGAAILSSPDACEITVADRHGTVVRSLPFGTRMPLASEIAAFVDHLRGGPSPKSTIEDAIGIARSIAEVQGAIGPVE
jgi:predicted dehydrogenase